MPRPELLATARVPDTTSELRLYRAGDLYSIKIMGRGDLMNTRAHGSERALATLALERAAPAGAPRVLVGGLGCGFTLAAALEVLGPEAELWVAELVPEVVAWNRQYLGDAAGRPLDDPRCRVYVGDVAELLRAPEGGFDAILLDVDNGPEAILRRENDWLYGDEGLAVARTALRPGGVLAIWSAGPDAPFLRRLRRLGFEVEEQVVRPHRRGKGARHHVWLCRDPAGR
jgi:spermidine synthase